jgi:7-cyano-7-deazaguanine synthase in queuosine biosynthesis
MNEFGLKFTILGNLSDKNAARNFYWTTSGTGSFITDLLPRLGNLGPVNPINADLVRLAVLVWAADRSVLRAKGNVNWSARDLSLIVPVSDPTTWSAYIGDLEYLLGFLSGDNWTLTFKSARFPKEAVVGNQHPTAQRVVLLSGGADSAIGALLARTRPEEHVLLSVHGGNSIAPVQRDVAEAIRALIPEGSAQHHVQVHFRRHRTQPNGFTFKQESSTRTRSLLYLALGLSIGSVNDVPLWIPENGFASLNPPMSADQFGSVSTKTTHPWFLAELSRIAAAIGAHGDIENPFITQTKGEMFRWAASTVGHTRASQFLKLTDSCGFISKWHFGIAKDVHCGVCFGCLMRRASFAVGGIKDCSTYAADDPPNDRAANTLRKRTLMPSLEGFLARGISLIDIAAMRLPAGYSPGAAYDLCQRGVAELSELI